MLSRGAGKLSTTKRMQLGIPLARRNKVSYSYSGGRQILHTYEQDASGRKATRSGSMSRGHYDSSQDTKSPECSERREWSWCPGLPWFPVSHVDSMTNGQGERDVLIGQKGL